MVLFVTLLFSLVVFSELNFAHADIYQYAALHSSSIQSYFADGMGRNLTDFDATNAQKIWMLVRHGSRTAKPRETIAFKSMENGLRKEIIQNCGRGTCGIERDNLKKLKEWTWDDTYNHDRTLTESGAEEIGKIAENYRNKFSNFFSLRFDESNFNIIYTNRSRSEQSAYAFYSNRIFKGNMEKMLKRATVGDQEMIKAYTDDNLYDVKNKVYEKMETHWVNQYLKTVEFETVIEDVNERLGFGRFKGEDERERVMNMYDLCRYEGTWKPKGKSVWCSMFTMLELLVLEYSKDLHSYSENGPSDDLNKIVQCPSVRDMVDKLSTREGPKVTTYFTHSPAILLHLTAMGAFLEEKLSISSYQHSMNRKWQTSIITPMAANLAAVLHKDNSVKFYLNGKALNIPGCVGHSCSLDFLKQMKVKCKPEECNRIRKIFDARVKPLKEKYGTKQKKGKKEKDQKK